MDAAPKMARIPTYSDFVFFFFLPRPPPGPPSPPCSLVPLIPGAVIIVIFSPSIPEVIWLLKIAPLPPPHPLPHRSSPLRFPVWVAAITHALSLLHDLGHQKLSPIRRHGDDPHPLPPLPAAPLTMEAAAAEWRAPARPRGGGSKIMQKHK